jgi:mono/diheme cytochrome c family protein
LKGFLCALCVSAVIITSGCRQDMHDQPKYKPLAATTFFEDGRAARPLVEGTVARGQLKMDQHFYTGRLGKDFAGTFPYPVTRQVLQRGRERFNIFCSPCHGQLGDGQGVVVQRGFRPPPSFHVDRLREAPVGQIYDAITNGFGAMPSYASRIPPRDRWAIVAYLRALQLSQHATLEEVPAGERQKLGAAQ